MSKPIKPPSPEELVWISNLTIDPTEGKIYNTKGIEVGFKAGGYFKVGIERQGRWRHFKRSHLVWFEATGSWPTEKLDHDDRDKTNDRFDNLQYSTYVQNALNAEQYKGHRGLPRGVCYDPNTNSLRPFKVSLVDLGQKKFLGRFTTAEEASEIWQKADTERRLREKLNSRQATRGATCNGLLYRPK